MCSGNWRLGQRLRRYYCCCRDLWMSLVCPKRRPYSATTPGCSSQNCSPSPPSWCLRCPRRWTRWGSEGTRRPGTYRHWRRGAEKTTPGQPAVGLRWSLWKRKVGGIRGFYIAVVTTIHRYKYMLTLWRHTWLSTGNISGHKKNDKT